MSSPRTDAVDGDDTEVVKENSSRSSRVRYLSSDDGHLPVARAMRDVEEILNIASESQRVDSKAARVMTNSRKSSTRIEKELAWAGIFQLLRRSMIGCAAMKTQMEEERSRARCRDETSKGEPICCQRQ